jgi:hypothetical protein
METLEERQLGKVIGRTAVSGATEQSEPVAQPESTKTIRIFDPLQLTSADRQRCRSLLTPFYLIG